MCGREGWQGKEKVVRFKLGAVVTNNIKYAVSQLRKSGQTFYIRRSKQGTCLSSQVCLCVSCPSPQYPLCFSFCSSMCIFFKNILSLEALELAFLLLFFFLPYHLNRLSSLGKNCTEILWQRAPKSGSNRSTMKW